MLRPSLERPRDDAAGMGLMRSVLQDSPAVTNLFAGSVEQLLRDVLAPPRRAFFQWGSWYELQRVDATT